MKVPLLDLKPQYASIRQEIDQAIQRVVSAQAFILGPEVEALENEVAAYSGCSCGVGVSSGTDALLCALMALGVGPGDEVILPTYTFFATAGVVWRLGAKPVFVDIEPDTYNIDPAGVQAALTDRTKAIIVVHLYGQCAEMAPIMELAGDSVYVVEDAAQAIGAEHHGRRAGSLGHVGCFSFFPTKNLGGFGDGGMIVTNDQELGSRCRAIRVHGAGKRKYYHDQVGGNYRLDALQAAVVRAKLVHLDEWSEQRRRNAARYNEMLSGSPVVCPQVRGHNQMIYNQYVVRVPRRDEVQAELRQRDIGTAIYYPVPLHMQECFAELGYANGDLPVSEQAARETLALPIYPELSERQQEYVAQALLELTRQTSPTTS
jgi:dTDP-4-amino-4,6-dideoxygalactose transaminase